MLTPERLRAMTLEANNGFKSKAEAERQERIRRSVELGLATFEENAVEASKKGASEAEAYEIETDGAPTFDALGDDVKEVFALLKRHFESRGFKTHIHGPYTSGGPSHVYGSCYDLIVSWGE